MVLPKSRLGGLGSRRLLRGTLSVTKLGLLQAVNHKLRRSPVHPGSSGVNLRRVEGSQRTQASDSGRPEALPKGQAKRPKQVGQLSYARVAREGLRVAVVCENYPESQISKENFTKFRGRSADLWKSSLKRGSPQAG